MLVAGVLLAFAGMTCAALFFRPELSEVYHNRKLLKECMDYSPAPESVAVEYDESLGALLLQQNSDYTHFTGTSAPVFLTPKSWIPLASSLSVRPNVIFLHWRQAPGRPRRLVAVSPDWRKDPTNDEDRLGFFVSVIDPGGIIKSPFVVWQGRLDLEAFVSTQDTVRIQLGQPDVAQSDRFMLKLTIGSDNIALFGALDEREQVTAYPIEHDKEAMDRWRWSHPH